MLTLCPEHDQVTYLCSACGKKRRPAFVLIRRGMCQNCYRVRREQKRRAHTVPAAAQRGATYKLDQVALVGGITLCLTALLGAISSVVPLWMEYAFTVPIILVALATLYGMAIGSHALLTCKIERRPNCIERNCGHSPWKVIDLANGQSFWQCKAGHNFYMGRFSFLSRHRKWAW